MKLSRLFYINATVLAFDSLCGTVENAVLYLPVTLCYKPHWNFHRLSVIELEKGCDVQEDGFICDKGRIFV